MKTFRLGCAFVAFISLPLGACMSWRPIAVTPELANGAKLAMLTYMKDPSSAQFGDVFSAAEKDNHVAICGRINGRNGFGGYVGSTTFAVMHDRATGQYTPLTGQRNDFFCGLTGANDYSTTPPKEILAAHGIATSERPDVSSDYNLKKRKQAQP